MTAKEYNACVDRHADALYRFILRGMRDSEKARDLVQDAFERLWRRHGDVDADKARSFLFTTGYHAMIDQLRRDKRLDGNDSLPVQHHSQHYSDLNEALHAALERLPAVQRMVVLLRDYEGYDYEEIGRITGLNASQVKVYIYRARMFLKGYIGSVERMI